MLAVTEPPQVSVVMPVHNAMPFLDIALESILGQTFADFEFVILDDASTDGSTERLREWASRDERIRLIEEKRKLGPALSSERVARASRAKIVARMDADDISHPDRLMEQLEVFARYPDTGVVACLCDFINAQDRKLRGSEQWRLIRRSPLVPFAHGAMTYRREIFDAAGGYRRECEFWEDQDLVTRMARLAPVLVIPRSLYKVRFSATSTRAASEADALEHAVDIMYRSADRLGGNRDYDDLLKAKSKTAKVDPRVYISLGSQLLWAGGKPRFFRRMLRNAELAPDLRTLSALVWTAWASFEPRSLRAFLRVLLFVRNVRAAIKIRIDGPVAWPLTASSARRHASGGAERPKSGLASIHLQPAAKSKPARVHVPAE
jgi:glycosyltransferase involved in cell wall biosynthesis